MSITKKDVEHIAHLARIELTDAEKSKFETELSKILTFVEKLNEVDTTNVEPMTGGTFLNTVMREDQQIDASLEKNSAELLAAAPDKKDNWIKVPSVFK